MFSFNICEFVCLLLYGSIEVGSVVNQPNAALPLYWKPAIFLCMQLTIIILPNNHNVLPYYINSCSSECLITSFTQSLNNTITNFAMSGQIQMKSTMACILICIWGVYYCVGVFCTCPQ